MYEQYGRASKLLIHPRDVPQIPMEVFNEDRQVEESENIDAEVSKMVDISDESRTREELLKTGIVRAEQCVEILTIECTEVTTMGLDYCDKSRSRYQSKVVQTVRQNREHELSKTTGTNSEINAYDESSSRRHEVTENRKYGDTQQTLDVGSA